MKHEHISQPKENTEQESDLYFSEGVEDIEKDDKNPIETGDVISNADSPDPETWSEKYDFNGDDLDILTSELDGRDENIGYEDEEGD